MLKSKPVRVVLICVGIYLVFAAVVITLFHLIRYNPIDQIAMPFLWQSTEIEEEYGEIRHIGRRVIDKTEKQEAFMNIPYGVETEKAKLIVYVHLVKENESWRAESYEITEVRSMEDSGS